MGRRVRHGVHRVVHHPVRSGGRCVVRPAAEPPQRAIRPAVPSDVYPARHARRRRGRGQLPRRLLRPATLAAALLLVATATASADQLAGDADLLTAGAQASVDLGDVAPGATVSTSVGFELRCANSSHVDRAQTVLVEPFSATVPPGGSATATTASIGPVPDTWPTDGTVCPSPAPVLGSTTQSAVTLTAPTTGGTHAYDLVWRRRLDPAGSNDSSALQSAFVAVRLTLTVVANTPPTLDLPDDLVVEGDTAGGWTATYGATASDAEDDPDPTPTCTPAPGSLVPLGTTTVACSVTDSGGLSASGAFQVTVVDTTAPTLVDLPGSLVLVTADPSGATVEYAAPGATDVVDPAPSVACDPPPGGRFPVGTSTVTCLARDGSGNAATGTFEVTVRLGRVAFGEPIGTEGRLVAVRQRTIPVKLEAWLDGVEVEPGTVGVGTVGVGTVGEVALVARPCPASSASSGGGATAPSVDPVALGELDWQAEAGRWFDLLDVSALPAGCHWVAVVVDGVELGGFEVQVVSPASASRGARPH